MDRHWLHVRDTFEALSYIVKECDPDGFEVEFTGSQRHKYRGRTTTSVVDRVARHTKSGHADMQRRLADILRPKLSKLNDGQDVRNIRSPRYARPINLYVLTDGIWAGGNNAKAPILEAIDSLQRGGFGRMKIGISFISFGNDEDGMERLRQLDELGSSKGEDL